MRILIMCEQSQIVCAEFRAKGHDAFSCDIVDPLKVRFPLWYIQSDSDTHSADILYYGNWDMVIAHPPCTCLTSAGQWYYQKFPDLVYKAEQFFRMIYYSPVKKICIENPAGVMTRRLRKPDQYVHPYYFGEPHMKRTGLWLKGLPKLVHTEVSQLEKPAAIYTDKSGKKRYYTDALRGGSWERNRTFVSIARAMADQWG